ncbi:UNVERIFIED_CONTAM: hypothetical protein GTU68_039812 [Idotea baltica]|nr:hypothetical protein [Idotea baltica]
MLENDRPADDKVVKHIDRCLSCLSCMTTCPSGVNYMHLVDHARSHIEKTYTRSWHQRLMRSVLASILPYPGRFRMALAGAFYAKPFAGMLKKAGGPFKQIGDVFAPGNKPAGRVALLTGCAQPVLNPGINEATVNLLNRANVEIVLPKGEGCCGALVHHMGRDEASHHQAKANIDAWWREIEGDGLDAIIITASGCGTTIKDYGHMLREDTDYAEKAAKISALAKDVTEYLSEIELGTPQRGFDLTVAYHSACSMQHGQQIKTQPKELLESAGFKVMEVPEGHLCCGSAGVYNILQPDIARQLRDRKIANIERTRPDIIATGNIGCMTQIGSATELPILHTAVLLNWAYGGAMPEKLHELGFEDPAIGTGQNRVRVPLFEAAE